MNFILKLNLGSAMINMALATLFHILYGQSMVYSSNDVRFLPEDFSLHRTFGILLHKVIRDITFYFFFYKILLFLYLSIYSSINDDFKFILTNTCSELYTIRIILIYIEIEIIYS